MNIFLISSLSQPSELTATIGNCRHKVIILLIKDVKTLPLSTLSCQFQKSLILLVNGFLID